MTTATSSWANSNNAIQISGQTGLTYVYTSPAGTNLTYTGSSTISPAAVTEEVIEPTSEQQKKNKGKSVKTAVKITAGKNINPKVFFKFVKSKLDPIDLEDLTRNLNKLKKLVVVTEEIGQQALFEELSLQLAIAVREQEAHAAGYDKRVNRDHIEKFRKSVKDKVVKFEPFENFPRVIPAKVLKQIQRCKDLQVFDSFSVLFIDYTEQKLKTNKEKIREKDPILFGQFSFQPDVFYYVIDWVDAICDLSFKDMLGYLQEEDAEFELEVVPDVDEAYVLSIVKEVHDRTERLKNTRNSNYKDLMEEEEKVKKQRKDARGRFTKKDSEQESAIIPVPEGTLMERLKRRIPFGKR